MAENKVQIVIEVDAAKGTASIRNVQDAFGRLQGQANALTAEYGHLTARTRQAGEATQQVQPAARLAAEGMDRLKQSMGAANETLALYEELYRNTGHQDYANAAIEAMKTVLDSQEKTWVRMLGSEQDARTLRIKREDDYAAKIKSLLNAVVDATVDAEAARTSAVESGVRSRIDAEDRYASASQTAASALQLGRTTSAGTYDTVYGRIFIDDRSGAQAYAQAVQQAAQAAKSSEAAAQAALLAAQKSAEAAAAQAAAEARRLAEQRQNAFDSVYGRYSSLIQDRTRRAWGTADYNAEFSRLGGAFETSQYYEDSLDLLGQMLDVLAHLDSVEQQALAANKQLRTDLSGQSRSIADWLGDLSRGDLAPVQSAAAWSAGYEEKRLAAKADTANIDSFLSYARDYLEFEKAFGNAASYQGVYSSVIATIEELGGYVDLMGRLAGLGLGSTASELAAVIEAFASLGVGAATLANAAAAAGIHLSNSASAAGTMNSAVETLKNAAFTAAGAQGMGALIPILAASIPNAAGTAGLATGGLSEVLQGTETPFANVAEGLAAMTGNVQSQIGTVETFFQTLAQRMGLTFNGSATGTAIANLTPAPVTTVEYVNVGPKYPSYTITVGYYTNQYGQHTTDSGYYDNSGRWTSYPYTPPGTYLDYNHPNYARGGLTRGISIAGEAGPEWIVPTYEPERSRFLASVPSEFWADVLPWGKTEGKTGTEPLFSPRENGGSVPAFPGGSVPAFSATSALDPDALARALTRALLSAGIDGDREIHIHLEVDGREISHVVADGFKRGDTDLVTQARRRMAN